MSAEICRRPSALMRFLRNRRTEYYSGSAITYWESKQNLNSKNGEPVSSGRAGDLVAGQELLIGHESERKTVYSTGIERPTIEPVLLEAGIAQEKVDPQLLLDYSKYYQHERLSEALRREREGELTNRWAGYLRDVRAYLAIEHNIAIEAEN